jgi:hypothetical protein
MKNLQEFRIVEEEKQDYSKFDALVRAGLGNKAQIQRMHQILAKMGEEKPQFTNADRTIIQNLFNKMVELITNNPQMFRQARKSVSEGVVDTADYKLSASGKKVRAHRVVLDKEDEEERKEKEEMKEEVSLEEAVVSEPPFIILLKRTAVRLYPNGLRVATYTSDKLKREFAIPFVGKEAGLVQSTEEYQLELNDGTIITLDEETDIAFETVYDKLDEENKQKFFEMLYESKETFEKLKEFVLNKQ